MTQFCIYYLLPLSCCICYILTKHEREKTKKVRIYFIIFIENNNILFEVLMEILKLIYV